MDRPPTSKQSEVKTKYPQYGRHSVNWENIFNPKLLIGGRKSDERTDKDYSFHFIK